MDRPPPTFTPIEWRMLAGACENIAAKEREQAARIGGKAARDYIISAESYEQLARRCMERAAP